MVHLFRGLAGDVFSRGLDKASRRIPGAHVHSWNDWQEVTEGLLAQWRGGAINEIRLAGHSMGATAAVDVARKLAAHGIPVDALVLLDMHEPRELTHNVRRVLSVRQPHNLAVVKRFYHPARPSGWKGGHQELVLDDVPSHSDLDDDPRVQRMLIEWLGGASEAPKEEAVSGNLFESWTPRFMRMFMEDFQMQVDDAAAAFGNAGHESNGYATLQEIRPVVPGSRGGYGLMQWTGPRRVAFEAYCERNGYSPSDMMANYKWLWNELKGPESAVLAKLRAAEGLDAKVKVFMDTFLRPGVPHLSSRIAWARKAKALWEKSTQKPADSDLTLPVPSGPDKPAETLPVPAPTNGGALTLEQLRTVSTHALLDAFVKSADIQKLVAIVLKERADAQSPTEKEPDMKNFLKSKTIFGLVVAAAGLAFPSLKPVVDVVTGAGVPVPTIDPALVEGGKVAIEQVIRIMQDQQADAISKLISIAGILWAGYGRWVAKGPLTTGQGE